MTNFEFIQSKLSEAVTAQLGNVQAVALGKANKLINEQLDKLINNCPPVEEIEKILKVVQAIKPVLDKTEEKLEDARKVADILEPAITVADIIIRLLTYNPVPVVIGTIAINGTPTLMYSPSTGKVNRTAAKLMWFAQFVGMLRNEGRAIAQIVQSTEGVFDPIVNRLEQIETLAQACLINQNITDEERRALLDNIQGKLTQEQTIDGITYNSKKSGKEYTIKVILDVNSPQIAPKRQAIVQDFRGITVLTGPSSFASRPQVLIDEIKFRIENQLP